MKTILPTRKKETLISILNEATKTSKALDSFYDIWIEIFRFEESRLYYDLLKIGIAPSSAELSNLCQRGDRKGTNCWHYLSSTGRHDIFSSLLETPSSLPTQNDLAIIREMDNTNAWIWLAGGSEESRKIMQSLLDMI